MKVSGRYWTSDVGHVTGIQNAFRDGVYHQMWENVVERFRSSSLVTFLTPDQINITADKALRLVLFERAHPDATISLADTLYTKIALEARKFFPEGHNYIAHRGFSYLPNDTKNDYVQMLTMAGRGLYDWEMENGRVPTAYENHRFLSE